MYMWTWWARCPRLTVSPMCLPWWIVSPGTLKQCHLVAKYATNECKWCHLVAKNATNASGAMLLISLIQVTESISGSVVPLAMFTLTFVRTKVLSLTYSTGRECPLHNFVNLTLYKFVECSYIFAIRFCCFLLN